jgi:hypothetical protein
MFKQDNNNFVARRNPRARKYFLAAKLSESFVYLQICLCAIEALYRLMIKRL